MFVWSLIPMEKEETCPLSFWFPLNCQPNHALPLAYVVCPIYLITLGFFCVPVISYLFFTTLVNSPRRVVCPCHRSTTICFSAGSDLVNWATVELWFGETDQETRANGVKGVLTASWKNKHFRVFIIMKRKILLYNHFYFYILENWYEKVRIIIWQKLQSCKVQMKVLCFG